MIFILGKTLIRKSLLAGAFKRKYMERMITASIVWLFCLSVFGQSTDSVANEITARIMTGRLLKRLSADALEEKGGRIVKHVVEQGETMGSIAESYGISLAELECTNPFDEQCYVGMELDVPVCMTDAELYDLKRSVNNSNYARAEKLFEKGDYKGAIKIYSELAIGNGPTITAHYNRGIAYYRRGRLKRAMEDMAYVCRNDKSGRFPEASKLHDKIFAELERRKEARKRNWMNFLNGVVQVVGSALNQYAQYQGYASNAGNNYGGGSALNTQFPPEFDFSKYDFAARFTTDANGNIMTSYPGLSAATGRMNAAVQTACSQVYGKLMATGDSYYMSQAVSLQQQCATNNWTNQLDQLFFDTPMYPVAGNTGNTDYVTTTKEDNDSTSQSCSQCHGIKKCFTCNGNRKYINPNTNKYVSCPNCTNGLCSACGGTGKKQ